MGNSMKFLDKYIKFAAILCRCVAKRYDIIDGKKLLTIKQKRNLVKTRQVCLLVSDMPDTLYLAKYISD